MVNSMNQEYCLSGVSVHKLRQIIRNFNSTEPYIIFFIVIWHTREQLYSSMKTVYQFNKLVKLPS